jgi:hypothetical protein
LLPGVARETTTAELGPAAIRAELGKYVFAYLGIHEPYYTRGHFPAFGVFIAPGAESYPACNASRRDLDSPEVTGDLSLQFLLADDSRKLAALELAIDPRHDRDFWKYWGAPEHWGDEYSESHWTWVHEFHFYRRVACGQFAAVLWPNEMVVDTKSGALRLSEITDDAQEFRQANPQCKVVLYEPSVSEPARTFTAASAAAARYYLENGEFPEYV